MIDPTTVSMIRDIVAIFGVIAGFSYYVMTVRINQKNQRQQIETRQAQLFMEIYRGSYNTEMMNHGSKFWLKEFFNNFEAWKENVWLNDEVRNAWGVWVNYYEGVGVLVKEDLIDIRLVAELISGITRKFWEMHQPIIEEIRDFTSQPRFLSETEYLYNRLVDYWKQHPELAT